jgi:hypothetical protein
VTVSAWVVVPVQVILNRPGSFLSSLALASGVVRAMTGRSSSIIVPIPVALLIVPPTASVRLTVKVSSSSRVVSPLTLMLTVLLVSPGLKVMVPVAFVCLYFFCCFAGNLCDCISLVG